MPLLEVDQLVTEFDTDEGRVRAVDGVSFSLEPRRDAGHCRRVRLRQERDRTLHHAPAATAHRARSSVARCALRAAI